MPYRKLATKELAALMGTLSHPHRIRIIEELRNEEKDVNCLADALSISHSSVSQHLSLLRARRLVEQRREGRHVFYSLPQPALADWLISGFSLIKENQAIADDIRDAIESACEVWGR